MKLKLALVMAVVGLAAACGDDHKPEEHPTSKASGAAQTASAKATPAATSATPAIASVTASAAASAAASGSAAAAEPLPEITGKMAPDAIQKVVRTSNDKFKACYEAALKKDPKLAGTVKVAFTIKPDGKVDEAKSDGSDMKDLGMLKCVVDEFKKLTFPKPEGGKVTVKYPIKFSPLSFDHTG